MLRWVGLEGNLGATDRQRLFFPDNIEPGRRERLGGWGDRKSLSAFQPLLPWIWQISSLRDGYCRLAKLMSSREKATGSFFASWWRNYVTETADYTQDIYLHVINTFQPLINTVLITRCSWKAGESLELWFSSLWGSIAIKHLPLPEWALPPFLYINVSRKCHVWEQGYRTLGKQRQNRGSRTTEGEQNRDLVRSASVNCENYPPVLESGSSMWTGRVQPL